MPCGVTDRKTDRELDQDFCPKNMLLKLQRAKVCLLVTILSCIIANRYMNALLFVNMKTTTTTTIRRTVVK